jgi:glycylpeptide N-tetradecanoyltransferase
MGNQLPSGYEWVEFDPTNDQDIHTMTNFLNKHYQKFDKEYKPNYLKWLFTPPTIKQYKRLENIPVSTWFVGVMSNTGVLVGLITARPTIYRIDEKYIQTFTIDFLCTHKQLRKKRLAPVLIKEMYKRLSTFQYDIGAWFVSNTHLPFNSTVKTSQILFRPLTLEKLSKTLFSGLSQGQLITLQQKYENIQPTDDLQYIRFANLEDIPMMMNIYENYCKKYRLCQTMNREEFEHYFLPNNEMIFTYVITNIQGEIKDFISLHAFWTNRGEKNAYLYYVSFINEDLLGLFMRNILFIMKCNGFDMIFTNDIMGVSRVFTELLDFKSLDEICNYYIFNYNTHTIEKNECGMNRTF